jgi:DNA repair exonuclease SbcCD ATPase subunit
MSDSHTLTTQDIQALLSSSSQWEKVDRIIFLTFKTLCDYLQVQSLKLEKLEKSIDYFSSSTQNSYQDLSTSLDLKVSFSEMNQILEKKVSKNDLSFILANKANLQDLKSLEAKCAKYEDLDKFYEDFLKRWQDTLSKSELEDIYKLIETKPSRSELEEALACKANKQAVANALHKKINRNDLESLIANKADSKELAFLSTAIEAKVDYSSFESFCKMVNEKVEEIDSVSLSQKELPTRTELKTVQSEIEENQRTVFAELEKIKISLKTSIEKMKENIESRQFELVSQTVNENEEKILNETLTLKNFIKQKVENLENENLKLSKNTEKSLKILESDLKMIKENNSSFQNTFKELTRDNQKLLALSNSFHSDQGKLQQDLQKFQKTLEDLNKKKANLSQLHESFTLLKEECLLETRQEIHQALISFKSALSEDTSTIREEIKSQISKQEQALQAFLEKKVNTSELLSIASDISTVKRSLDLLAAQDEVDLIRDSIESVQLTLKKKIEGDLLEKKKNSEIIENIWKELSSKVENEDFQEVISGKVGIEEINKSIEEIYDIIDKKVDVQEFEQQVNGQSVINEALCAENRLARWIWKAGDLNAGNVVWDTQAVNTSQDVFVWDKGKVNIQVLQPGLYMIEFGFFAKKKPTVGVVVNGETIIIGGSSVSIKPWGKTTCSGITLVDYLVLPGRSRICVNYAGVPGEGFFGIKKL